MEYLRSVLDRITTWFYDEQRDEESGMKEIRLVNKEYNKSELFLCWTEKIEALSLNYSLLCCPMYQKVRTSF